MLRPTALKVVMSDLTQVQVNSRDLFTVVILLILLQKEILAHFVSCPHIPAFIDLLTTLCNGNNSTANYCDNKFTQTTVEIKCGIE